MQHRKLGTLSDEEIDQLVPTIIDRFHRDEKFIENPGDPYFVNSWAVENQKDFSIEEVDNIAKHINAKVKSGSTQEKFHCLDCGHEWIAGGFGTCPDCGSDNTEISQDKVGSTKACQKCGEQIQGDPKYIKTYLGKLEVCQVCWNEFKTEVEGKAQQLYDEIKGKKSTRSVL